jgi:hypothetical protein
MKFNIVRTKHRIEHLGIIPCPVDQRTGNKDKLIGQLRSVKAQGDNQKEEIEILHNY